MMASFHHRFFLHNTLGMKLCEDFFGAELLNSDESSISVREIARRHIAQDLNGHVPSIEEWINIMKSGEFPSWINRPRQADLDWLKQNIYDKSRTKEYTEPV